MPCNVNSLNITIVSPPSIILPGFSLPSLSPIQPNLNIDFPEIPLDVLSLIQTLIQKLPFGMKLNPIVPTELMNDIMNFISSVLSQLSPFLSLYSFIQALLNLVMCIIDIICALFSPWDLIPAVIKLFTQCLPPFLDLFPWIALLVMIVTFLLLIIALIIYIITAIIKIIEDLIANIVSLVNGLQLQDEDAIIATITKIAALLCNLENILGILVAIASVIAIIEALAKLAGRLICSGGDSDSCPPFVVASPDGIITTSGTLLYYKQINYDLRNFSGFPAASLPAQRVESWQIFDEAVNPISSIDEIIAPNSRGTNFWPIEATYDGYSNPQMVPYTVELTLENFDPEPFHSGDLGGARKFIIKEAVIRQEPTPYPIGFNNQPNPSLNVQGTASLIGGLVYEANGITPYKVNGVNATLGTFIHYDASIFFPAFDDGYIIPNIGFTLSYTYPVLLQNNLITVGCIPEISAEIAAQNARLNTEGIQSVFDKMGPLPNPTAAYECSIQALQRLRSDLNGDTALIFQDEITLCLLNFKKEVLGSYLNALVAAASVFKSTVTIDPDVQFITRPIKTTVILKDPTGSILSTSIPEEVSGVMDGYLSGNVTLGNITGFVYDGYESFLADITSDVAGDGYLSVQYNGQYFQDIIIAEGQTTKFAIRQIPYTFVDAISSETLPRRDAGDVSRNGGN